MAPTDGISRKISNVSFLSICSIFVAANLIASSLSHIDDTDETYGYYEPLHYLLHGIGMQTWEYSPSYAIRTYAFLTPFWLLGSTIKLLDSSKVNMFYGIRTALGIFTALSESYFLVAIYEYYGKNIGDLTLVFTLFSSGILYCSTALLPSAVIMSLVMIATASWMRGRYVVTILIGCISVLWSGWPFIGIIYVPFGLQMLCHTFFNSRIDSKKKNDDSRDASVSGMFEGSIRVFTLIFQGACILVVVGGSAAAVDFYMYKKRTFPTWNILLYNAIGGSGDELYGIEPMSYYIRNLALNMNISWPLAAAAPILLLREYLYTMGSVSEKTKRTAVLFVPVLIWLTVLFSRPHKEERFLYPIYPLLAFMGAYSLSTITNVIGDIVAEMYGENIESLSASTSNSTEEPTPRNESVALKVKFVKNKVFGGSILIAFLLFSSRSISNYINFGGYIALWTKLGNEISMTNSSRLKDHYTVSDADIRSTSDGYLPVTVCIGGDWYTFPSHFFLPPNARLQYVRGNFHGQLPQHFRSFQGTSSTPIYNFNDKNEEEESRYVAFSTCDYLVATLKPQNRDSDLKIEMEESDDQNKKSWSEKINSIYHKIMQNKINGENENENNGGIEVGKLFDFEDLQSPEGLKEKTTFSLFLSKKIIDPSESYSAIARAFFIPGFSGINNVYNSYSALKKVD